MVHLLNLLAAIALLVWGTQIVRTGILSVFGESLRHMLAVGMSSRPKALLAGLGVTSLIQSSTATCLIVASFLGRALVPLAAALAVMLGADIGTSVMAVVFSFDLSWLSPLLIFGGVVAYISREKTTAGRLGRVAIGLGLILLSLQFIVAATRPLVESPAVRAMLAALPSEVLLDILVGAVLTVLAYSSLAIVLLTATLAVSGIVPTSIALGLVLGANLGSGLLAVILTAKAPTAERRLPMGNLVFKFLGAMAVIPLLPFVHVWLQEISGEVHQQVVLFHLGFNLALGIVFIGLTGVAARLLHRAMPEPKLAAGQRPAHLDPSALATPSLAISCAAREALHQADVVETMLRGVIDVIRRNDLQLAEQLRRQLPDLSEALRLLSFIGNFAPIPATWVPEYSILREFSGDSGFKY
jgi:phosphate:Na+ symporter